MKGAHKLSGLIAHDLSGLLEHEGVAPMRLVEVLLEVRRMRFEEAYHGWQKGRFKKVDANFLKSVGPE